MLASRFNVSYQAIIKILDNKENYIKFSNSVHNHDCKKVSMRILPVDSKVSNFSEKANRVNSPVSRQMLKTVALENSSQDNADFKASTGWFDKFMKRHNVSRRKLCGEAASVDEEALKKWVIEYSPQLLMYEKKNVYNCDETGLIRE